MNTTQTPIAPPSFAGLSPEEIRQAIVKRDANRMAHAEIKLKAHGYAIYIEGATPNHLMVTKGRNFRQRCVGIDALEALMREELGSV